MRRLRGLYAITPEHLTEETTLASQAELAIAGGATLVQYRHKGHDETQRRHQAQALLDACAAAGAALIINDDLDLAARVGAHGVHLGRDDAHPREARERLGPGAIIGVSCYDSLERGDWAERMGADYAAFGRFFASQTKPDAVQADPGLLGQARARLSIPLVAIGGITPENGGSLVAAGADMLAVVEGVFGRPDIRAAARTLSSLFSKEN